MKPFRYLLTALFLLCFTASWAKEYTPQTVPDPKATNSAIRFVSNPDSILSMKEMLDIDALCKQLNRDTQVQLAVVVLEGIGNQDIFDFSQALFSLWGIGDKERNDGLLIVYLDGPHKVRIHVGRGLEGDITDAFCSHVINGTMIPVFKDGRAGQGLLSGVSEIYDQLAGNKGFLPLRMSIEQNAYTSGTLDSFKDDSLSLAENYRSQFSDFDADAAEKATGNAGGKSGGGAPPGPIFVGVFLLYTILLYVLSWNKEYDIARDSRKPKFLFYFISVLLCCLTLWALVPIVLRLLMTRFYRCPRCGRICLKKKSTTLQRANFLHDGLAAVTWSCKHCGTFTTEEVIYYKTPKSSSGSDSDSDSYGSDSYDSSDSWGGGDSDGGGASGSW